MTVGSSKKKSKKKGKHGKKVWIASYHQLSFHHDYFILLIYCY